MLTVLVIVLIVGGILYYVNKSRKTKYNSDYTPSTYTPVEPTIDPQDEYPYGSSANTRTQYHPNPYRPVPRPVSAPSYPTSTYPSQTVSQTKSTTVRDVGIGAVGGFAASELLNKRKRDEDETPSYSSPSYSSPSWDSSPSSSSSSDSSSSSSSSSSSDSGYSGGGGDSGGGGSSDSF